MNHSRSADHVIAAGQIYRALRPHRALGPARIQITEYDPSGATADGIDPDTGAGCVVLVEDLHPTATDPTGARRRDGYVLENP
ncbi:hypothetical protein ACWCQE_27680 [Streptomyces sp. NPDC002409]|uniref:hypothetical protein n=1 Tax=Streptomyces misionensis TaxID=67331 RepID=UPI0036A3860D